MIHFRATTRLLPFLLVFLATILRADDWIDFETAMQAYPAGREDLIEGMRFLGINERGSEDPNLTEARLALQRSWIEGNPVAAVLLAALVEENYKRVYLLRNSVKAGLRMAVVPLAESLYQHGKGNPKDFPEALEWFLVGGEWQDEDALFYAGRMFHFGHGIEEDPDRAILLYEQAVEAGSIRAANNLANLYYPGRKQEGDLDRAIEMLTYASDHGMAMASQNLGRRYRASVPDSPDWPNAIKYYRRAVEQGGDWADEANLQLGRSAEYGYGGEDKEPQAAVSYYEKAAEAGNAEAAFRLGRLYRDGNLVETDKNRAADLFQQSAAEGFARSQFALARMLETGQLGEPDPQTAMELYREAAEQDHTAAATNLAWILWETDPEGSLDQIHQWHQRAIDGNSLTAKSNYGYLHLFEKIPDADPEYGLELTIEAAENDVESAIRNLIYYYEGFDDLIPPDPESVEFWKRQLKKIETPE